MSKESLFNEYEAYTRKAQEIADEFHAAIKPIFEKHLSTCTLRELTFIALGEASCIGSEMVLNEAFSKVRAKKNDS